MLNERKRADVSVYWLASKIFIHSDELNPVASKQRDTFVERMPESPSFLREETGTLLQDLAELVLQERANAKPDTKEAAQDPFPAVEPWKSAVTGAELLDQLVEFINRYVIMPPSAAIAVALWTLHTYLLDVADYTPYLLITSPVRECGKTTTLELLLHLAHRAQMTGGITAGALYRRIDRLSPTMLLDELDTRLRGDAGEMLRGVLNNGFQRSGKITICVGDEHLDRDFSAFCPKVLSGIGRVWDTVTSRSIPLRLARATKAQLALITKIRGDRIGEECLPLRRRLVRWADDNREVLRVADPVAPAELGARQSDVWRPLLGIADVVGGRWPGLARTAACALHGVAEEEGDHGLLILQDLKSLFESNGGPALTSSFILQALTAMEDRPWSEYRNDRPISTRGLAQLVGRFGVKPKNIRQGGEVVRGYEYSALLPAFTTYLTPTRESATSATVSGVADVADRNEGIRLDEDHGEAWEEELDLEPPNPAGLR